MPFRFPGGKMSTGSPWKSSVDAYFTALGTRIRRVTRASRLREDFRARGERHSVPPALAPTALPEALVPTRAGALAGKGGGPGMGSHGRPPDEQAGDEEGGPASVSGRWDVIWNVGVGEGLLDQGPTAILTISLS